MAKSKGALHSEIAKGSTGAITHRVYRGTGTVSKHRAPSRVRMQQASIQSVREIKDCFSLHSAGVGYVLSGPVPPQYCVSIMDQCGGFGTISAPSSATRPKWFPADPAHNNRPYLLPNGINQFMYSSPLTVAFAPPLDIWVVASDTPHSASYRCMFSLYSLSERAFLRHIDPQPYWSWRIPLVEFLTPASDDVVKIWRIILTSTTIQVFWNGIAQSAPKALSITALNQLRLFSRNDQAMPYDRRLFEIATWRRILNPVEAELLLRFYRYTYDII